MYILIKVQNKVLQSSDKLCSQILWCDLGIKMCIKRVHLLDSNRYIPIAQMMPHTCLCRLGNNGRQQVCYQTQNLLPHQSLVDALWTRLSIYCCENRIMLMPRSNIILTVWIWETLKVYWNTFFYVFQYWTCHRIITLNVQLSRCK